MDINTLLSDFKETISKNEYENYISLLTLNEKQTKIDYLVFNAPNELMAKFIQSKYAKKITNFYEIHTGNKALVKIQTSNKKYSKNNKKINIEQIKMQSTILNISYTFKNFVIGDSNKYAYSICERICSNENLGKLFNPIFIYGSTGLGKTHLLQAVGNECLELGKKVIYATSENFMNDFTSHLANKNMNKFQEKYRNCDVLLIDDIQLLGKTEKTQDEFFHTFNEVINKNGQIIITSDTPPNILKGITERLKSRFVNGIIADITPPEFETKIAIIRKKCEFNKINLNNKIITYIASSMGDNIREIEGVLISINAYSRLMRQDINFDIVKAIMKDHIKEQRNNINIDDILDLICKDFNLKLNDIKSNNKERKIVMARRIAIFLSRELINSSMPTLAKFFGMKDHTAISHNLKKINENIENNNELRYKIEEIKNKILKIKDNM